MRFGHLAKVKNTSKKIEEIKHVEKVSLVKIDNNDKSLDLIFLANNPQEILENESKNSQIHPKKHNFLSKDFGLKNMITQNISKKINTKFDIFQEKIEPPTDNIKKNNPNATAGLVFVILALFCALGIISILATYIGFAELLALVALTFLLFLFSLLAVIFGAVALGQMFRNPGYYANKTIAIIAVIFGLLFIISFFFLNA